MVILGIIGIISVALVGRKKIILPQPSQITLCACWKCGVVHVHDCVGVHKVWARVEINEGQRVSFRPTSLPFSIDTGSLIKPGVGQWPVNSTRAC